MPNKIRFIKGVFWMVAIASGFLANPLKAQLLVSNTLTPQQWVQNVLIGQGIQVSNITYTGVNGAGGTFTGNTNLGIASGVILTSGAITNAPGPNNSGSISTDNAGGGDPDLNAIAAGTINDACLLEFDFIPESDTVKFRYVFGSDEYHEWANSSFNDVFGFFISGPGITGPFTNGAKNIALLPNSITPVSINNVNNGTANTGPCLNCQFLVNNPPNSPTIQYDAFTVVLTAKAAVIPCNTYHIKLAVSDVGDGAYDSGVFLEANSFSSVSLNVNLNYVSPNNPQLMAPMAIEGCRRALLTFTMPFAQPDSVWVKIDSIYGSAVNGIDYTFVADSVLILPYHISGALVIDPIYDGIVEGIDTIMLDIKTAVCGTSDTTLYIPIADYFNITTLSTSNDTLVCEGQVPLQVNATGGSPPYIYQWTPIGTLDNPYIANPLASPTQTTLYHVEVRDSTRCSLARDSVLVTYYQNPMISFKPDPYSGCDSLTVNFSNITTPNILSYVWDFGDGDTSHAKNPTHVFHGNSGIASFYISLTAVAEGGCTKTYVIPDLITVFPNPKAAFAASPDSTSLDAPTITFVNQTSSFANHYLWNFGDSTGSTSTSANPVFTYSSDGVYTVWLWVETDQGCKDSISHRVIVVEEVQYDLTIPNIITPGASPGKNDKFEITNLENYTINILTVYDRWGKKVFEQSPYLNNWDGDNLPSGTYFVVLRYKKKKEEYKYDGVLNILRE